MGQSFFRVRLDQVKQPMCNFNAHNMFRIVKVKVLFNENYAYQTKEAAILGYLGDLPVLR